jgi:hypothetical protein
MVIMKQQSVWGELDDKWKLWERNQKQDDTNRELGTTNMLE